MENQELIYLSAAEILSLYRAKKLSPVEMLNAQIQQIERYNDKVNCIVANHFDEAMDTAKESEQRYMDGNARPLEGITCAIKDDAQVTGWRHSWGTLLMKDIESATFDFPIVDMLRQTRRVDAHPNDRAGIFSGGSYVVTFVGRDGLHHQSIDSCP